MFKQVLSFVSIRQYFFILSYQYVLNCHVLYCWWYIAHKPCRDHIKLLVLDFYNFNKCLFRRPDCHPDGAVPAPAERAGVWFLVLDTGSAPDIRDIGYDDHELTGFRAPSHPAPQLIYPGSRIPMPLIYSFLASGLLQILCTFVWTPLVIIHM